MSQQNSEEERSTDLLDEAQRRINDRDFVVAFVIFRNHKEGIGALRVVSERDTKQATEVNVYDAMLITRYLINQAEKSLMIVEALKTRDDGTCQEKLK